MVCKLVAKVNPENTDYINKEVIWRSSNRNIVSVDKDGNIQALKKAKQL